MARKSKSKDIAGDGGADELAASLSESGAFIRVSIDAAEEFAENEARLPWSVDYRCSGSASPGGVFEFLPNSRDVRGRDDVPGFLIDPLRHRQWNAPAGPSVTIQLRAPKQKQQAKSKAKRRKSEQGAAAADGQEDDSDTEPLEPKQEEEEDEDDEPRAPDAKADVTERGIGASSAGAAVRASCFEWELRMDVGSVRRFEEEDPSTSARDPKQKEEEEEEEGPAAPREVLAVRFLPIRLLVSRSWLARRLGGTGPAAPLCANAEWLAALRTAVQSKGLSLPPPDELTAEDVGEIGALVGQPVEEVAEQVCSLRCWAEAEEGVRSRLEEAGASRAKQDEAAREVRELRRDFAEEWRMEALFADPSRASEWWWQKFNANKPERPADVVAHVRGLTEAAIADLMAVFGPSGKKAKKGRGSKEGAPRSGKPPPAPSCGKRKA